MKVLSHCICTFLEEVGSEIIRSGQNYTWHLAKQ